LVQEISFVILVVRLIKEKKISERQIGMQVAIQEQRFRVVYAIYHKRAGDKFWFLVKVVLKSNYMGQ
jgi:hypothetical protein